MTIHHLFPVPSHDTTDEGELDALDSVVLQRQPMAEALDRVRTACADLGLATLLAELDGVSAERAAEVLDEVALATRRAITTLRALGTTARGRRALG